ncbi:alpha-1B-glycoprotein-like [Pelodiscus sinensis]|uniref:alpha-1B-glycoprotein-like n=1 Tax=Pelodiscus sinensis TaxID=13735 RepID=UPI003F6B7022
MGLDDDDEDHGADPLPAPSLSLDSSYKVYLPREQVTLTCSAPPNASVSGYRFFLQNEQQGPSTVLSPKTGARLSLTAEKGRAGSYTCAYWRQESNGEISSGNSSAVSITVRAPLPAPRLSATPQQPIYIAGETVTLTCSATGAGIRFFRAGQEIKSEKLPSPQENSSYSIKLSGVSGSQAGAYSCGYWRAESGREIPSERSRPISIAVTARPPVPKLTLSSPHGIFIRGESVTLTCSASSNSSQSEIRFFQNGRRVDPGKLHRSQYHVNASLPLSNVSESQAGAYSCDFRQRKSGREIPSQRSRPVSIAVTAPLPAPQLSATPQQPIYIAGETVTLTCSATGAGIRFFRAGQEIKSEKLPSPQENSSYSIKLSGVSGSQAGAYSCGYWRAESGREIPSERSRPISIAVTARPPAPKLTLSSPHGIFIRGESVTLTCSASSNSSQSEIRFFQNGRRIDPGKLHRSQYHVNASLPLSNVSKSQAGVYSCDFWERKSEREIPSERSQTVSITVTDPLPQPELSLHPPSGVAVEQLPLLLTCTVPRDAWEQRFHFYKDGVKLVTGDLGSEIWGVESGNGSMKVSVLIIPWASPNRTGDYTCNYDGHVNETWIPSLRSRVVTVNGNITDSAQSFLWVQELVKGGSFFLINGLIFLIAHCCS